MHVIDSFNSDYTDDMDLPQSNPKTRKEGGIIIILSGRS